MKLRQSWNGTIPLVFLTLLIVGSGGLSSTEPCGDFGECKALVEINSSDGDIGFHFLADGDDLKSAAIMDPLGRVIFADEAGGPLLQQRFTEVFVESAEPSCRREEDEEDDEDEGDDSDDDEDDEDGTDTAAAERVVTLKEFLRRWTEGTYRFRGIGRRGELNGATSLTFQLPAAPQDVAFDGSVVSWARGDDLGECGSFAELNSLVAEGSLWKHPVDVAIASWEIVLEPDVEDGVITGGHVYRVRVRGSISPLQVSVPSDYLQSLPADTPLKIEVGAIGWDDNATFTEEDGFCVNQSAGCEEADKAIQAGSKSLAAPPTVMFGIPSSAPSADRGNTDQSAGPGRAMRGRRPLPGAEVVHR